MPSMNFRREFGAISGLSFVLVVVSSLALGAVFAWLIPGLGLAWGSRWARGSGRRPEATNPRCDLGAAESPARCQGRRKFQRGALNAALAVLDANQISLELKGAPTDHS